MSTNTDTKKRGGRPATGRDPLVALRMPKQMTEALSDGLGSTAAGQPGKIRGDTTHTGPFPSTPRFSTKKMILHAFVRGSQRSGSHEQTCSVHPDRGTRGQQGLSNSAEAHTEPY